jgi:Ca2+/Na+ antiporter
MKHTYFNKLNSIVLIAMGLWAYLSAVQFGGRGGVPGEVFLGFGVILFLCNFGLNKEIKIISYITLILTLLLLMPLITLLVDTSDYAERIGGSRKLSTAVAGMFRVLAMIVTSVLSIVAFFRSRKKRLNEELKKEIEEEISARK